MPGMMQKVTWGVAAMAATKVARSGTRRALHDDGGAVRLPGAVRQRNGFLTAVLWAVTAGVLLGLSDILREQRKEVAERS
jgi:hypothetical protein